MLKKRIQNDFIKNILTLFTGTAIAQFLPVAITPILTRMYGPNEFGILALYMAIISILSVISTGRYELAIMIPKKDYEAINIAGVAAYINVTISILLFLLLLVFGEKLSSFFGVKALGFWVYFIPLSLVILGFYEIIYYWLNRRKMYKDMSVNKVIQQAGIGTANISIGYVNNGIGLILGTLIGQLFALLLIVKKLFIKEKDFINKISKKDMVHQAKRFINFPKFFMFAHTLNVSSRNLAQILFSSFFNSVTVGYFTLTQRVLGLPVSLIGSAISDVFRQEASVDLLTKGNCKELYIKTFKLLFLLAIIPFTVLYFISPWLFSFVFGAEWRVAGEYARLMMPMLFFQFITSPLSTLSVILEKNKYEVIWQTALFLSTTSSLVIGYKIFSSIKISIILFTFAYSVMYIIDGLMTYRFAVTGRSENIRDK
ncbi:oligosaccharide flippase family protein [Bacillus sp. DTU_2020_1000418_1_SI_GHA_SEK_038]|uniref:lipopolysaccharide biosynthesis protein n=1 Tax=Bacillus sp. DTU_2020_1000418_1_SI_GHA_SEK_038 TaxID=3077585 RepID=UPI0028E34990|nr:oligosaccharide flippase family protein [Bacillus sp. DTU_2020_1000418_1_SI_GHA_SEK_038]WNS74825.1 oligosaccharide flippase family protein [Bacillus sp. DTU_2020_1000418_1_SI_GHA_SEK_038]